MFVNTNPNEKSQTKNNFSYKQQEKLLQEIHDWNRQVPKTKYSIIIKKQPFTGAVNIFTLWQRPHVRAKSKSLIRFSKGGVTENEIKKFVKKLKHQEEGLHIEVEI